MRRLVIGALAGMIIPLYSAHADVNSDLNTEQPMAVVFENAEKDGLSVLDTLEQVIDARFDLSSSAICTALQKDAEQAEAITSLAISKEVDASEIATSAGQCAPLEQVKKVFTALSGAGIPEEVLVLAAFDAGLDPTQVLQETAAGPGTEPGDTPTPAPTGQALSLPAFGTNTGGGGGTNASPS